MEHTFKDTLLRQRDLIPIEVLNTPITIVGAGAVGSWTALALVKMGFANLTVQDMDTIDVENMNCQFYPQGEIGSKKVTALQKMIEMFTGITIQIKDTPYVKGDPLNTPIVIGAVDNMQVRRDMFDSCTMNTVAFLDPRMGAETMALYTMNPNDEKDKIDYVKAWHSDEDSVHEACTAKATIYCANILAGLVACNVKKIATKQNYSRVLLLDLPSMGYNNWNKEQENVT